MPEDIKTVLNPYALKILEDWGAEDAKYWVSEITSKGLPESIHFEDAQAKAESSFNNNIGANDFLKFTELSTPESMSAARDYYINFFIKKSSKYLKEKRDADKVEKDKFDKKLVYMSLQGHASAARWFTMMETSSSILSISKEELSKIAGSICECFCDSHDLRSNDLLKQAFINLFIKEACMLIRSLEEPKK